MEKVYASRCSLISAHPCIQPIFMGHRLRLKHCARSRIQRGMRHRPVFRVWSQEDVGGREEREMGQMTVNR